MKRISNPQNYYAYNKNGDKQFCKIQYTFNGYVFISFFMKSPFSYKRGNWIKGVMVNSVRPVSDKTIVEYRIDTRDCGLHNNWDICGIADEVFDKLITNL